MSEAALDLSYRRVLAVPGFPRLIASTTLARTGNQMSAVVLVLFVLTRFGSASLAGLTVFLVMAPGLVVAPVAGALLDRGNRMRLVVLDYAVAAVAFGLIAALASSGHLASAVLLLVVGLSSLTNPLSNTGTRSLYPVLVPRALWDRANAIDSIAYVVASIAGPGAGGALVAVLGGPAALAVVGAVFAGAAVVAAGVRGVPPGTGTTGRLFADAWAGLVYVVRNRSLRGLAVTVSMFNLGQGIFIVGLPVLALERLHRGAETVGALWAVFGVGGLVSVALVGRFDSEGRERALLGYGGLVTAAGALTVLVGRSLWVVGVGVLVMGISNGPIDIGLFSLRQRRTDPDWMGRAFAVSMSLNFAGVPLGSALAGPLLGVSIDTALAVTVATTLAAAAMPALMVPGLHHEAPTR